MIPNMKFYVVSIVAIFTALGLGIYIGFSMDTEGFITDQQENLVSIVETQFETLIKENKELVEENENVLIKNKEGKKYIDESYDLLIPEKLAGKNIALIESNGDYASSSIGHDIEEAGGNLLNLTTVLNLNKEEIANMTNSIINGNNSEYVRNLASDGKVEAIGNYNQKIDYIILAGGSESDNNTKISVVDKSVIDMAKSNDIKVVGVEKFNVENSYTSKYREYGLTTVDNINTKMGKIATVLSFDAKLGSYGVKGNAESIIPTN